MFDTVVSNPTFGSPDPVAAARVWVTELRDLMRSGDGEGYNFNIALPSPRYIVSDILEFRRSNHYFFAFVVRDTTMGFDWLFLEPGPDADGNGPSWFYYGAIGGTSSGAIYSQFTGSAPDNTGGPGPTTSIGTAVYFSGDYATDTFKMEFDNTTALTYTGGDFSHTSTKLPADTTTKANAFLPTTNNPRGAVFSFTNPCPADRFYMFDEDDGFLMGGNSKGGEADLYQFFIMGDTLETPSGSGDTYTLGTIWFELSESTAQAGKPTFGDGYVDSYNLSAARVHDYNLTVGGADFTRQNWFIVDGGVDKARWRAVGVENAGNVKGWVKTSIMRQLGVVGDGAHHREPWAAPSSALPGVRHHWRFATAYVAGVEIFPFSFATKE